MLSRGGLALTKARITPQSLSGLSSLPLSSQPPSSSFFSSSSFTLQNDPFSSSLMSLSREHKWEQLNQTLQEWKTQNPSQPLPPTSQQALLFALSSPTLSPPLRASFSQTLPPPPSSSLPPLPPSSSSLALRDTLSAIEGMASQGVKASVKNWMKIPGLLRDSGDPDLAKYAARLFVEYPPPDVDVSAYTAMMNSLRQIAAYEEGILVYGAADKYLDGVSSVCEEDELRLRTTATNILGWWPSSSSTSTSISIPLSPFDVYNKMASRGVKPDVRMLNILLHLCKEGEGGRERVTNLVQEMERLNLLPTPKTLDALLAHVFEKAEYDPLQSFDESFGQKKKLNMADEYVNTYCSMTGKDEQGFLEDCSEFSLLVLAHNYLSTNPSKSALFTNELMDRFTNNLSPSSHPQTYKDHRDSLLGLVCRLRSYQDSLLLLKSISRDCSKEGSHDSYKFDRLVTNSLNDYLSFLQSEEKGEEFLGLFSAISTLSTSPSLPLPSHRRYLYQIIGDEVKEGKDVGELFESLGVTKPMLFEMLLWLGRRGEGEGVKAVLSAMEKMGIDAGLEGKNAQIQVQLPLKKAEEFMEMIEQLEDPHVSTFNLILHHLNQKSDIDQMFNIYHKMEEMGVSPDIATLSLMTDILLKKERADEVVEFVQKMAVSFESSSPPPSSPSYDPRNAGACYNTMMELYGKEGNVEGVMRLLHQMASESALMEKDRIQKFVSPSSITYNSLLKSISTAPTALPSLLIELETLLSPYSSPLPSSSYTPDASLCWRLTRSFVASKDIENAKRSLDILKMSRGYRIEHLLTEGVVGLVKLLEWEEGEEAGKELMREIVKEFMWLLGGGEVRSVGRVGSGVLVNNLVEGVVGCGMVEEGERLWRGLEGEWFKCLGGEVKGGMLEMFYKERKWELVEELVRREKEECGGLGEEMRQKMVALLCESGDYEAAEQLLSESKQYPLPFSLFHTLLPPSSPATNPHHLPSLPLLHSLCKQNSPLTMVVSPETIGYIIGQLGGNKGQFKRDIVQFYKYGLQTGPNGQVPRSLFERMIHVCCQIYAHPHAIQAIRDMKKHGHQPDAALYHTIIKSLGRRIGEYAMVNGFELYRDAISSHLKGFPSPATLQSLEALCLHQKSTPYASLLTAELSRLSRPCSSALNHLAGGKKGKPKRERKEKEKEREGKFDYSQNKALRERKSWMGPPK